MWLAFFTCWAGAVNAWTSIDVGQQAESIPPCGPACVYTVLRMNGRHVGIAQLQATFREVDPKLDWQVASLWHLREALARFGVNWEAREFRDHEFSSLSLPAILYFEPGQWPGVSMRHVGHFVVLAHLNGSTVTVADWQPSARSVIVELPRADLEQRWSGIALVDASHAATWGMPTACGIVVVLIVALFALRFVVKGKLRLRFPRVVVGAWIAMVTCGCDGDNSVTGSSTHPTLLFEEPSVNLGLRNSATPMTTQFKFRVWDESTVRIVGVATSCGCSSSESDIIGRDLQAASEAELSLVTRPRRGIGANSVFASVTTDPPSPAPLVIAVHYELPEQPQAAVSVVVVEGMPNLPAATSVEFVHRRRSADGALQIDRQKSQCTHFHIANIEMKSESGDVDPRSGDQLSIDRYQVQLQSTVPCEYGAKSGVLRLAWGNGEITEVPTLLRVARPVEPSFSNVFAGVLKPQQEWSVRVPCRRTVDGQAVVATVESPDPALQASFSNAENVLQLRGKAPATSGRFSERVILKFDAQNIPALEIPITGIVAP